MSSTSEGPLTLGRVIGDRYEVLRVLHSGTTGTVYEARVLNGVDGPGRVALKVLHPKLCVDRQLQGRFEREARILERLDDEHHASLLDYVVDDELLILALRYVDGPSLAEVLAREQALPAAQALDIAIELCEALEAAHEAEVIHRDLKPSNVLLEGWRAAGAGAGDDGEGDDGGGDDGEGELDRGEGDRGEGEDALAGDEAGERSEARTPASRPRVRVVDFGLAKILHGDTPGSSLTEQDMIFGTPDYMSPEQVRGDELDPRADLYSVGAVLFEMLTGEVPFPTAGPLTTMTAHLKEPIPSARDRAPSRRIPEALESILTRALAKDRAERFASAGELARALRAARQDLGGSGDGDPASATPASAGDPLEAGATAGVGTTMKSPRDALLEGVSRGAKVRVQVLEAEPDSAEASTRRVRPAPSQRKWVGERGPIERRLWTVVAVIAAAAAVGLGVWLGVR